MKKLLSFFLPVCVMMLLGACANELDESKPQDVAQQTINSRVEFIAPSVGGAAQKVGVRKAPVANPIVSASFFIRIDGNVPEQELDNPAENYFPRRGTDGNYFSVFCGMNEGKILDGNHWREGHGQWTKYLYASDAVVTQQYVEVIPSLENLVKCNQVASDMPTLNALLEDDDLHIIWYLIAYDSYNFKWHVDGVVTTKDRTDVSQTTIGQDIAAEAEEKGWSNDKQEEPTPESLLIAEVEFDVHQQMHQDWHEIKTSIHLRDTVDARILLPIPEEYQAQADDFAIRAGVMYEYISKTIQIAEKEYTVDFTIEHAPEGIVITIAGSQCREALRAARQAYGDGLTFEVHTYAKAEATTEQIWSWIRQTQRPDTYIGQWTSGSIATHTRGQVTSAYYPEAIRFDEDKK